LKSQIKAFDERKLDKFTQIGGMTHKCVTMKRVSKDLIVVDHESNQVGFLQADSLALIATKNYQVEGYLTGALGFEGYHGKVSLIYLWFSSGDIILIDSITFEKLSSN
jgi:hypothetical protein